MLAAPAGAQEAISWAQAERLQAASAPLAAAADHEANAAELTARSLDTLRRPSVTLSAQAVAYEKTLSVDLSGVRERTADRFGPYLDGLPGQFPSDLQGIAAQVASRIDAALPGLLGAIPDTLDYEANGTLFRPSVSAFMPLYMGGAIPALQDGAGAAARAARARADAARNLGRVDLARIYFGQSLAEGLEAAARDQLEAMEKHLSDTEAFYRAGVLPRRRVLEVTVVRDAAARNLERASLDRTRAEAALARVLGTEGGIEASTPLFVHSSPLASAETYASAATAHHPRVREAEALRGVAEAGVRLARARSLPQAYAFGNYGIDGTDSGPTEPDWIAGVGVRWSLLSPVSRSKTEAAAREREAAAIAGEEAARRAIETEIADAWALAEAARRSFLSLESSLAAAEENARVAAIAYREGEGTASDLLDARAALTTARTQRLAAAYEYDVALAVLMAASGTMDQYGDAIARADKRIAP
ncbi:TolC family protein [Sphingomicrobium nitratireducens]|uniref:TolC family protein n=1 Tax=Sphingomicrobium nitratireducens TaxID=2964666 RepID=UPI00223FDC3B|nr:TolC family protein [Sphingomicrobium nitratireducens]